MTVTGNSSYRIFLLESCLRNKTLPRFSILRTVRQARSLGQPRTVVRSAPWAASLSHWALRYLGGFRYDGDVASACRKSDVLHTLCNIKLYTCLNDRLKTYQNISSVGTRSGGDAWHQRLPFGKFCNGELCEVQSIASVYAADGAVPAGKETKATVPFAPLRSCVDAFVLLGFLGAPPRTEWSGLASVVLRAGPEASSGRSWDAEVAEVSSPE